MERTTFYQLKGLARDDNPASLRIVERWVASFEELAGEWDAPMGVRTELNQWRWALRNEIDRMEEERRR